MIAAMNIAQFHPENIYMCKPIKNKIMSGGMFTRIIYSSDTSSMNGIYVSFDLGGQICEIYPSKFKIQFVPGLCISGSDPKHSMTDTTSSNIIKSLCDIEHSILTNISITGKIPHYKLRDQLIQNNFKFFWLTSTPIGIPSGTTNAKVSPSTPTKHQISTQQTARFILKISGCWTTPTAYGITYKFSRVSSTV